MKGNLNDIGKQLLNQAGEAAMGAAKEYIGKAIQEMLIVKKQTDTKRVLPSIEKMKIVSEFVSNHLTNVSDRVMFRLS